MNCTSTCLTKDHRSWGECMRAKNLGVAYCRSATNPRNDATAEKRWNRELDLYESTRKEGIQPDTTQRVDIERARKFSDLSGQAYGS